MSYLKSLIGLAAVLVIASSISIDDIDMNSPYFENYLQVFKDHGDLSVCNKSYCDVPCEGAGPPPICPDVVPICVTGCACLLDCENAATICFEPKHCLNKRLYLTGKRSKNINRN